MKRSEFEKKWLESFVPDLTEEQYESCFVGEYLWHVFSYKLIPEERVLMGDKAREAYEKADKEQAFTIRLWLDEENIETEPIREKLKDWKKVDKLQELYVVDRDWKWTYVSTHENGWLGPYFYEAE